MEALSRLARTRPGTGPWPPVVRIAAGVVFVGFSFGKFFRHQAEQAAFERYGIPVSDAATYLVGSLELVGGLALVIGLLVRPFALALAGNMIGAISTAGRIDGGPVHLLLAPALLLGMVLLLWAGPGSPSLDQQLLRRCRDCSSLRRPPARAQRRMRR
jgi:putative oxidoreductase